MSKETKEILQFEVYVERIPPENNSEFYEWCKGYGFNPIDSDRRAWCGDLSTYIRDADYMINIHGFWVLLTEDEYTKASQHIRKKRLTYLNKTVTGFQ